MPTAARGGVNGFTPRSSPESPGLFHGLTLCFLGFQAECLHVVAAAAAAALAAAGQSTADTEHSGKSASDDTDAFQLIPGMDPDSVASLALLRDMEEKAAAEGARLIEPSKDALAAASFFICNFAAAFAHLRRLGPPPHSQLGPFPAEPQRIVEALEVEPLRLLSPFWLFACLRDRRVYAPDTHALFRVSSALIHTQLPLRLEQEPHQQHQEHESLQQRVLLLGCTRAVRRVRRTNAFKHRFFASDSDEESDRKPSRRPAGNALTPFDTEILSVCVEALGGRCVTAAEVQAAPKEAAGPSATTEGSKTAVFPLPATATDSTAATEDGEGGVPTKLSGVDVVVVGNLHGLLKWGAKGKAKAAQKKSVSRRREKRFATAARDLALLHQLWKSGVPCVMLQWLLDTYRFGRTPSLAPYGVPHRAWEQLEEKEPVAVSLADLRKGVLQGVQVLISDAAASPDYTLVEHIKALGCTDLAVVPAFLSICPWLFRCTTTRYLAAALCGSADRMQQVLAALQRAEDWRHRPVQDPPRVLIVMLREDLIGLLDLMFLIAQEAEDMCQSQLSSSGGKAERAEHGSDHYIWQQASQELLQHHHKTTALVAVAQQRVLQRLTPEVAAEAQRHWAAAAKDAENLPDPSDDAAAVASQNASEGATFLAVCPDWIFASWEAARRLPIDVSNGRIEVDIWTEAFSPEVSAYPEDEELAAVLKHSGGAIIYGDLPVLTEAQETRVRHALAAVERAVGLSWELQQPSLNERLDSEDARLSPRDDFAT